MTEYKLFTESRYDRACGFYDTYGIAAFEDEKLLRIIKDISPDKEKVTALIKAFNEHGLEPQHLSQAVEEFLYDMNI